MRRVTALLVLCALVPSTLFAETSALARSIAEWQPSPELLAAVQVVQPNVCADSRAAGRKEAQARHSGMGWLIGGLAAGVGGGLIGLGVITPIAALSNPQPTDVPVGSDDACYREGYKAVGKSKNWKRALLGSALGTAAWFAWYAAATSD